MTRPAAPVTPGPVPDGLVAISTEVLADRLGFFNSPPWPNCAPFTISEVQDAIARGETTALPSPTGIHLLTPHNRPPRAYHLARIAHLVGAWANDGTDAPAIEVTGPGMIDVDDGCHRICAAIVRGDPVILVSLGGFLDDAETMFGISIP